MSSYLLGAKALKALVLKEDPLLYWRSKLSEALFRGEQEKAIFQFVDSHYRKFKVLPKAETLAAQFPETVELEVPELPQYYVDKVESRYCYDVINRANLDSQAALKNDQNDIDTAEKAMRDALQSIARQRYRHRLLDFGQEGAELLITAYHKLDLVNVAPMMFGWPYMDDRTGGALPGDVVSFVGRPAQGKTWFELYSCIHNWRLGRNVLFVSMEMALLAISQRIGAMYAGTNVSQLKMGISGAGYSSHTYNKFVSNIAEAANEQGKLYVVDGNLAASVEDIYTLADHLQCQGVWIDGAYLVRHPNPRLNRFEKVAENVEMMKRFSVDRPTFASWQFNRQGAKKNKKAGEKETLEDIGYSDAIGQISSIVIALMQEDTVETIEKRRADLMKGRNGEIGGWDINWNFNVMDFTQIGVKKDEEEKELEYL